MRLIDADSLLAKIKFGIAIVKKLYGDNDFCDEVFNGLFKQIEIEPTIEAEPVKHGNWGKPAKVDADNIGYKCSVCGDFGVPCWHHCPNCGAKMDGAEP